MSSKSAILCCSLLWLSEECGVPGDDVKLLLLLFSTGC